MNPATTPPAGAGPNTAADADPIEPMRRRDIDAVVRLEKVLFPDDSPWTEAMFFSELAAGHHYVVRRDATGAVLGYAGLAIGPDTAEVHTIGVAPSARRRGIGRALLENLLAAAGDLPVFLEVRCDNEPALALYASAGFRQVGLRRRYYQPSGANAYTLRRPAPGKITSGGGSVPPGDDNRPPHEIIRGER